MKKIVPIALADKPPRISVETTFRIADSWINLWISREFQSFIYLHYLHFNVNRLISSQWWTNKNKRVVNERLPMQMTFFRPWPAVPIKIVSTISDRIFSFRYFGKKLQILNQSLLDVPTSQFIFSAKGLLS